MRYTSFILFTLLLQGFLSCRNSKDKVIVIEPPDYINSGLPRPALTIDQLIQHLNTNSNLEGPSLGFTGAPSSSYAHYKQLVKIANDSILLRFTFHENPKMRVYGMWGLSIKNPKLAEGQLDRFYYDTSSISETSGCITMTLPIYDVATSELDSAIVAYHRSKMFRPILISY